MLERRNIAFESDGLMLRGWFYPTNNTQFTKEMTHPCIIMTHGFSGLKEHDLDPFARRFANAGYHVLVYDNRHFGESEGEPRLEVDPAGQIADLQAAITFVNTLPNVNSQRIGLWGTSFSAGIHLVVAALDKRVWCIVAQVPFVCGFHAFLTAEKLAHFRQLYQADELNRKRGNPPQMLKVASVAPEDKAILKDQSAYDYFSRVTHWQNSVTFRSLHYSGDFRPIDHIKEISPTPVLFIVASNDTINPKSLAAQAYELATGPKHWIEIPGDHFAPYTNAFDRCAQAAISWYHQHLM